MHTGYTAYLDVPGVEAGVLRSSAIDYVYTAVIPSESDRLPLFARWVSPMAPKFDADARENALLRISDSSIKAADGWGLAITEIAASHAEVVLELTYERADHILSGPWLVRGLKLENPIVLNTGVLEGFVDRRRCDRGAVYIWLRGFLFRRGP